MSDHEHRDHEPQALKPCPFYGGPASNGVSWCGPVGWASAGCRACRVWVTAPAVPPETPGGSARDAVAQWNRRAESSDHASHASHAARRLARLPKTMDARDAELARLRSRNVELGQELAVARARVERLETIAVVAHIAINVAVRRPMGVMLDAAVEALKLIEAAGIVGDDVRRVGRDALPDVGGPGEPAAGEGRNDG